MGNLHQRNLQSIEIYMLMEIKPPPDRPVEGAAWPSATLECRSTPPSLPRRLAGVRAAHGLHEVGQPVRAGAQRHEKLRSSFNDKSMGIKNSLRYYADRSIA